MSRRASLVAVLITAALVGCGPGKSTISGSVATGDGKPLNKGVISFVPADDKGVPATSTIEGGKYQVATTPGNKKVQISSPLPSTKRPAYNSPTAPLIEIQGEESLPAKYNSKTELSFEAKPGENSKDWTVEPIKK